MRLYTPIMDNVREANPTWFGRGNKRFFGDLSYQVMYGKKTGERFLVRKTNAWSDMFDGIKKTHWRVNPIGEALKILPLINDIFNSLPGVKNWLSDK